MKVYNSSNKNAKGTTNQEEIQQKDSEYRWTVSVLWVYPLLSISMAK